MKWLSENYRFLFDGVGGAAVIWLLGWLFMRPKTEKRSIRSSSIASGSGNIQTPIEIHSARDVHIAHLPAATQAPVQRAKPERSPYNNIKFIGAEVCSLEETIGSGRFIERGSQKNAIVAKFANVPRLAGENKTVTVKAVSNLVRQVKVQMKESFLIFAEVG